MWVKRVMSKLRAQEKDRKYLRTFNIHLKCKISTLTQQPINDKLHQLLLNTLGQILVYIYIYNIYTLIYFVYLLHMSVYIFFFLSNRARK